MMCLTECRAYRGGPAIHREQCYAYLPGDYFYANMEAERDSFIKKCFSKWFTATPAAPRALEPMPLLGFQSAFVWVASSCSI